MSRPRGFAPWQPRKATLEVLAQAEAVLGGYREHWPLTCRQVFYRLVGNHGYPKSEQAYARLCEYLNRARRSGRVRWAAIRDDGPVSLGPPVTDQDALEWLREQLPAVEGYLLDPSSYQQRHVELWVEAAGMVPMLAEAVASYGVPVFSDGGFASVTSLARHADRIAAREVPTRVLHVGDHDPSGVAVFEAAVADVAAFVEGLTGCTVDVVSFERVAVTPEQVVRYGLPTAPAKTHDRRGAFTGTETTQAEALPPDVLVAEVVAAVEQSWDVDAGRVLLLEQERERLRLADALGRVHDLLASAS